MGAAATCCSFPTSVGISSQPGQIQRNTPQVTTGQAILCPNANILCGSEGNTLIFCTLLRQGDPAECKNLAVALCKPPALHLCFTTAYSLVSLPLARRTDMMANRYRRTEKGIDSRVVRLGEPDCGQSVEMSL